MYPATTSGMSSKRKADDLSVADGRTYGETYPVAITGPFCHTTTRVNHGGTRSTYTCTREANHAGPHVAHLPGGYAAAVWRDASCNPLD